MIEWNSEQYVIFEKERTRPSDDLLQRIEIIPKTVLDIGCGPGNSTARIKKRFADADVTGIDSSENMLEKAKSVHPNLRFRKCLVPDGLDEFSNFDLIFSNACLHWIPNHEVLLPAIMKKLSPGGVFAVQMPLTREAEFYKILDETVSCGKWAKLSDVHNFHNLTPEQTYDILSGVSSSIEMWTTVYYHILPTHRSIIDWYAGSGLRTYLDRLDSDEKEEFISDLLGEIIAKYPLQRDGSVILKMPRMFFLSKSFV